MDALLGGMRVVTLALNVPGPVAAARLRALGAAVTKVEPPDGDPLQRYAPEWYAALASGQEVLVLDLRTQDGRARLAERLAAADLLLTSQRPAALARLGLEASSLRARFPRLCRVAIVGHAGAPETAGHDLTYVSSAGLVAPPRMPPTLMADLAGAERAVSAALGLLLARERGRAAAAAEVSLADAAADLAAPLRAGVTRPDGILGGGFPGYALYRARDRWIALAALEPRFRERVARLLHVPLERDALERAFATRTGAAWEEWAGANDVPLAVVREDDVPS